MIGAFPRVDTLFDGEPPPPPVLVGPRVKLLRFLLGVAIFFDVVGLVFSVVPGAALTLWAWLAADTEAARIEAGGHDEGAAAAVLGLRNVARWAMVLTVACLLAQAWLLHQGFYTVVWAELYDAVLRVWGRLRGG